jgi:peptidoglycan/LPS O-acetylase OafA/YrhL
MPTGPPDARSLGRSLSTYLDAMRFTAAMVVFVSHVALPRLTGDLLPLGSLIELADSAVIAFFVLSGFVISYAAQTRDRNFGEYALSRLARLYSVAVPALLLTVVADAIGRHLDPALYAGWWSHGGHPVVRIFACLLFANELWFESIRPFSDGPYWSLGYEFWYYALFAVAFYLRGRERWVAGALVALLVGPKILVLFPIWLLGVAIHRVRTHLSKAMGWALFLGSIGGAIALLLTSLGPMLYWWMDRPIVHLIGDGYSRHLPLKYATGLVVAANILGFAIIQHRISLQAIERPVRWLAGMTFSLYLFHYPLLHMYASALPGEVDSPVRAMALVTLTLVTVAALATVTERKKHVVRRILDSIGVAFSRRLRMVEALRRA